MDWRWVVAGLIVVGFLLTAGNLLGAFVSVRKQVSTEEQRISDSKALSEDERADMAARTAEQERDVEHSGAIQEKYNTLYDQRGLIRPSYDNLVYLSAYESKRIVGLTLDSTRDNLIWAGVGLFVSTIAGVWSLWL
ncbi:hypothetical protein ACPPVQ_09680 [Diaminobutyricibacter sp. McL0618]|uniref:hypothetical protein n=1 Tax=Leifsonia sp. McL0618 TaxID=3415677 RepID=UPI003CF116F2